MKELESQIDFERFKELEVIEDHYPLHRSGASEEFEESFKGLSMFDLVWYSCCADKVRFNRTLHLIKKYFGEKFSFFYGFYQMYNAYLMDPMLIGIACFIYQLATLAYDDEA